MSQDNINTSVISQFIQTVKGADLAHQKEIRIDIATAKNLSYTLALVMTRLAGNYENLLSSATTTPDVIKMNMDGGNW